MHWSGNTFSDNEEYGFDPHDFSNDFVVEGNTAHHNGKHGFIFSRGCLRNVLRGNTAYANVGHGFMIDDGRSAASATAEIRHRPLRRQPRHRQHRLRQRRQRRRDRGRHRQRGVGQPPLRQRHRRPHQVPARWPRVTGNAIDGSVRYGVHVLDPAARVSIADNRISGSWAAINLAAASSATLGDEPVDRRLDTAGDRRRRPARPVVDRPGGAVPALEPGAGAVGADPRRAGAGRASAGRASAPSVDTPAEGPNGMTAPHARGGAWALVLLAGLLLLLAGCAATPRRDAPRDDAPGRDCRRAPGCPGRPTCPRPTRSAARRPTSR